MDLRKNIISEEKFNNLLAAFFILLLGFILWGGYSEFKDLSKILDTDSSKTEVLDFETKYLQVSKVSSEDNSETVKTYVTVLPIKDSPPEREKEKILESNLGFSKISGLLGHPSFHITEKTSSFWKSQLFIEFFYSSIGLIIISLFYIVLVRHIHKTKNKIFGKGIGKLFQVLAAFIYVGFFLDMIIYGRLMSFLNETYYLGETITGGGSDEKLYLGTAIFFVGLLIDRASALQEEQDLTI